MNTSPVRPPRSSRRGISRGTLLVAVGLVAVAGAAVAWSVFGKGSEQATSQSTSDRVLAKRQAFEIATTANGELEARNKVEIRNPMERESTILEIMPEGARVRKGDVLIKINAEDLLTKLEEEQSRLKSSLADKVSAENAYEIQVNENNSKLRQAQLDLDVARLTLDQWREGDDRSRRQELDLGVQRSTVELERLAERYLKSQELCEQDFLSRDERDRDEVTYIQAISDFQKAILARETYVSYESPKDEKSKLSAVEKAESELERVRLNNQIELQDKASNRDISIDQYAAAERRLKRLMDQFNSATILAPQDGLVVYGTSVDRNRWGESEGPLQIGQRISPNQLLFILPDTSEMIASIRVHESIAGRIRPGVHVDIKVDAAGGKVFSGEVESIGVMAETGGWRDPNLREYTVRVSMDIGEAILKPSMRCEARVVMDSVEETLTVPVQAIYSDGPVRFVYQASGNKFVRVPVKVGRRSDVHAEIVAGLTPTDMVLLREPLPGEVVSQPWSTPALTLAGYSVDAQGQPIAAESEVPPAGRSGRPARPGASKGDVKAKDAPGAGDGKLSSDGNAKVQPAALAPQTTAVAAETATPAPAESPVAPLPDSTQTTPDTNSNTATTTQPVAKDASAPAKHN